MGQSFGELAAQLPAPDRAREDVEQHCQVDELAREADVRDVGAPDLIRAEDGRVPNQIRKAAESMTAVGRAAVALDVRNELRVAHDPQDACG